VSRFGDEMRRANRRAQQSDDGWAPEAGVHTAVVVDADLRYSKQGKPIGSLKLELRAGPHTGKRWEHVLWWTSDAAAEMACGQLHIYGITPDQIDAFEDEDDLARALDGLVGVEADVRVDPKDDGDGVWTKVLASRRNGSDIPADRTELDRPPPPSGDPDDDDIPF
jgi:hypothetical protein